VCDTSEYDRRAGNEKPQKVDTGTLILEERPTHEQQTRDLKVLIESLPPRYRSLITPRYFDELSYEEIAQRIDLQLVTVKAIVQSPLSAG
jgi:RNA polymerase sigma-70 factor (ECF subfamily)